MTIDELMDAARDAAARSPNRVRQVGAALVTADGATTIATCNEFPNGVRDIEERHAGDGRFIWMEHAERNALMQAARRGIATNGAVLATTLFPCIDCARAIVQSGVAELVAPTPDFSEPSWGEAFRISQVILNEGGVRVTAHASEPAKARGPVAPAPKLHG